jgi:orotidine-5'-phosphate decarboxylase
MNREQLFEQIKAKKSFLCVGLDTDAYKIPAHLLQGKVHNHKLTTGSENPIFLFNKAIIDATARHTIAYKPNLAFYEARAQSGLDAIAWTCGYIRHRYPEILIIGDAKRGDIGNTSEMYAEAFFPKVVKGFYDAVTLSPYMGRDTVDPFLKYEDKWAIVLALTSNKSADDFETLTLANGDPLWKEVLRKARTWGTTDNTMFVVGATRAEVFKEVREIVPDHFLLVPGVGAQGGSLKEVAEHGLNDRCGLLVNSSRGIIYAADSEKYAADPRRKDPNFFAVAAAEEARKMQTEMAELLAAHKIV